MPVPVSYPGVYIEEIPSGLHTITGVATSICAFVGSATRGPVDVPTEIFSFADFEQIFGGLTLDATGKPATLGFAVRDFFLNGGSDAIIVRVAGSGGKPATVSLGSAAAHADGTDASKDSAGNALKNILTLKAASDGVWGGNLYAQADTLETADKNNKSLFNLSILESVDGQTVASERFLNLSLNPSDANYVVGYLKANSALVSAVDPPANSAFPPDAIFAVAGTAVVPASPAPAAPAVPATKPTVVVGAAAAKSIPKPPTDGFLKFDPGTDPSGVIDVVGDPEAKSGIFALDAVDIFNILCMPPVDGAKTVDDLQAVATHAAAYCQTRRAIFILDPPDSWTDTWSADPSSGTGGPSAGIAQIKTDLTKLRGFTSASSSYVATYFPRLTEPNPLHNNQNEEFAASGAIAGIFARTDVARGVWKAPAGLEATITGATALSDAITNAENGKLNQIGVNCLRTFPLIGNVVWGSRTLDGADILASDYKYVPVRRFTLFLEESLYRGTQWVVFEPNDEPLWSQIRLNVGAFLHDLFRQGAFAGPTPQQAYFVQCDSKTTTQTDINNGIVNILVGFAPLKPAEFVILKIQQITGQIDV